MVKILFYLTPFDAGSSPSGSKVFLADTLAPVCPAFMCALIPFFALFLNEHRGHECHFDSSCMLACFEWCWLVLHVNGGTYLGGVAAYLMPLQCFLSFALVHTISKLTVVPFQTHTVHVHLMSPHMVPPFCLVRAPSGPANLQDTCRAIQHRLFPLLPLLLPPSIYFTDRRWDVFLTTSRHRGGYNNRVESKIHHQHSSIILFTTDPLRRGRIRRKDEGAL